LLIWTLLGCQRQGALAVRPSSFGYEIVEEGGQRRLKPTPPDVTGEPWPTDGQDMAYADMNRLDDYFAPDWSRAVDKAEDNPYHLVTGSMIFFRSHGTIAKLQRFGTKFPLTHVAIIVWSKWLPELDEYIYLADGRTDNAIIGIMEVTNKVLTDFESGKTGDGFIHSDLYARLQGLSVGSQIYIRPRLAKLNELQLHSLETVASALHARRPEYLKLFVKGSSEKMARKFYTSVKRSTKEEHEVYEYMFCSQFVALVVMSIDGPLKLAKRSKEDILARKGPAAIPYDDDVDAEDDLALPGVFTPETCALIDNGQYPHPDHDVLLELTQYQIPYRQYQVYINMAADQEELVSPEDDLVSRMRDDFSFAMELKHNLLKSTLFGYVTPSFTRFQPTWMGGLSQVLTESACFDLGLCVGDLELAVRVSGTLVAFDLSRAHPSWRKTGTCLINCVAKVLGPSPGRMIVGTWPQMVCQNLGDESGFGYAYKPVMVQEHTDGTKYILCCVDIHPCMTRDLLTG